MTTPESKTCPSCGHINSKNNLKCMKCGSTFAGKAQLKKEAKTKERSEKYQSHNKRIDQYQEKQKTKNKKNRTC